MVKDLKNGECFRADHLIESKFEDVILLRDHLCVSCNCLGDTYL